MHTWSVYSIMQQFHDLQVSPSIIRRTRDWNFGWYAGKKKYKYNSNENRENSYQIRNMKGIVTTWFLNTTWSTKKNYEQQTVRRQTSDSIEARGG